MVRYGLILMLAVAACDRAPDGAARVASAVAEPGAAEAAPVPPPKPVEITPTIRVLEMAGDMTLSEAERRQINALEARERAQDPEKEAKEEAELTKLLDQHAKANAVQKAKIRHAVRAALHINRAEMTDPLPGALLDRHDPVLVEDAARKDVVSMADIKALRRSNEYVGKIAGVSIPPLTEEAGDRAKLQREYDKEPSLRVALTGAGPRHVAMVRALDGLPANKRGEIDRVIRDIVKTPEDAANAARGMEQAVLVAEQRKAERARNAAAAADFRGWMQSRWQAQLYMGRMDGVMRALDTENRTYPR